MNNDKEFDKLFRQRFEETSMPVDSENWNLARQKLDTHYKKKKRRALAFWFFGVGILFILGLVTLHNKEYSLNKVVSSERIINAPTPELVKPVLENKIADKTNQEIIPETTGNLFKGNKTEKDVFFSKSKSFVPDKLSPIKNTPNVNGSQTTTTLLPDFSSPADSILPPAALAEGTAQNATTNNEINLDQPSHTVTASPAVLTDSTTISATPDSLIIQTENLRLLIIKETRFYAGALAGAVFSTSLKSGFTNKTDVALNYTAGAYLMYAINKKFKVELNMLYLEKSKLNRSKDFTAFYFGQTSNTQTEYGSYTENTTISTKTLQYLSFPILLKYQIGKNQMVEIGAVYQYLFNSKNLVTTTSYKNGNLETVSSTKASGYINGFNQHDLGLIAGYSQHLYKNINAFARFNFGLTDISKDTYFNLVSFDRTTYILVGIKIQLLKFNLK